MSGAPPAVRKHKVLLMGKSGSGKSSMRSVIFASYLARETSRLAPTLDVHFSTVRLLGSLHLALWDCGGQDAFFESYFAARRAETFGAAAVLIFVLDMAASAVAPAASAEPAGEAAAAAAAAAQARDLEVLSLTARALAERSAGAQLVVLLHKADLLAPDARSAALAAREAEVRACALAAGVPAAQTSVFGTSIFDETLYRAWSAVVHMLVPNVAQLEEGLAAFAAASGADEAVLFERASFLVVASAVRHEHGDRHRHERISNLVKAFKLAVSRGQRRFRGLRAGNGAVHVALDACTANTFLMAVTSVGGGGGGGGGGDGGVDGGVDGAALEAPESTLLNMALAREAFARLAADLA
jgi:Ras-related GTP-binding protein A/B